MWSLVKPSKYKFMDIVLSAIRGDLTTILTTGRYMLVSLFLLAVFVNYVGILSHSVNWADVIVRLVIGFVLLQNYIWIMDTTYAIVTGVDQTINPDQNFVDQYAAMSNNMQGQFQSNTQTSIVSQVGNAIFGRFSLHNLIINLSFIFYAVISKIMEAIRYSMTGILYKLGPVLIPLVLFKSTERVFKGWYTSYVAVLCWPILWHIALSIAVALSNQIGSSGQGIEQFACLNFAVCFVLIFSPFIINSMVAGVGAGSSGAVGGLLSTNQLSNTVTGLYKDTMKNFNQAAMLSTQTPTTSPGKFKDLMTGNDDTENGADT
ncbi:MAG: type IV secretion system protein [Candidatus Omnitrophica bacterium]|nr:type IV secretion system protein [Candidatus Omnitrophota bacterium]